MFGRTILVTGAGSVLTVLLMGLASPIQAQTSCTLTQGYWKNHPELWPVDSIVLGGWNITKAQALAVLSTPPRGDATYILAHQLIAAMLNMLNGADSSSVADQITEADLWLVAHPLDSRPTGADREAGLLLASRLDDFNNGLNDPPDCNGAPPPPPPED